MVYVILADLKKFAPGILITEITPTVFEQIKFKQNQIVQFVKKNIRDMGLQYKLVFATPVMNDEEIAGIQPDDMVLWHPNLAALNIDFVKRFHKSIVMLQSKTVLIQSISAKNPITENMAVNHGFFVMYLDENDMEVTNRDWTMVVTEETYLVNMERFRIMLNN